MRLKIEAGLLRNTTRITAAAPPPLNGEGEKVQSQWLFGFLKAPFTLRPWLEIRMPTFGLSDQHTTQLINYFNGLSRVENPFAYFDERSVPPDHLDAARKLVSAEYFNCFSCHVRGGKNPEGPPEGWAPDLAMARQRLNPKLDYQMDTGSAEDSTGHENAVFLSGRSRQYPGRKR